MERLSIDHLRIAQGKEPVDWIGVDANLNNDLLAAADRRASRTGLGPEASIHTAEKRGKEYGYAKKVSFYQCTNLDQANEINTQMAELSDDSDLVVDRVFVYKEGGKSKEAPKNSSGYHQGSTRTIGFVNGNTAEYSARNAPYAPGQQEASAKWFAEYADRMEQRQASGEEKRDPEIIRIYRKMGAEAEQFKDYQAHTVPGNGIRNPTIDHEFAHALVSRASDAGFESTIQGKDRYYVGERVERFAVSCQDFAKEEKFSVYAVSGLNYPPVAHGESIAETYAYWKSGKTVPAHIATGLRRLETYRGPGTGT
jgi:hypothetical protein